MGKKPPPEFMQDVSALVHEHTRKVPNPPAEWCALILVDPAERWPGVVWPGVRLPGEEYFQQTPMLLRRVGVLSADISPLMWLGAFHTLPRRGWTYKGPPAAAPPHRVRYVDRGGLGPARPDLKSWSAHELKNLERFGRALGLQSTHQARRRDWVDWERSDTACAYVAACAHLRAKRHAPEHGPHWGVTEHCHPDDPPRPKGKGKPERKGNPRLGAAACGGAIQTVQGFTRLIPVVEGLAAVLPPDKLPDLLAALNGADGIGVQAALIPARAAEGAQRARYQSTVVLVNWKKGDAKIRNASAPKGAAKPGEQRQCVEPDCVKTFKAKRSTRRFCDDHQKRHPMFDELTPEEQAALKGQTAKPT